MIKGFMDYCMQHTHTKVITIYTKNKALGIKFDYTTHIKGMEIMYWFTQKSYSTTSDF